MSQGAGKFDLTEDAVKYESVTDERSDAKEGSGNFAGLNFGDYLETRSEVGLTRFLLNLALEPQNPFKPDARRNYRKGFILATVFSALFIAWFVWFNVFR
jgi:hypothetical protein